MALLARCFPAPGSASRSSSAAETRKAWSLRKSLRRAKDSWGFSRAGRQARLEGSDFGQEASITIAPPIGHGCCHDAGVLPLDRRKIRSGCRGRCSRPSARHFARHPSSTREPRSHEKKVTRAFFYSISLRYSVGVQPVNLRNATLNELAWA